MINRRAQVVLLLVFGALFWALPASGASAATCTGSPHATGSNETAADAVEVTCDTAISSGSFTVEVNRGAESASAQVSNGTGSFNCSHSPQPPGGQFNDKITCTGSMSAGAKATVNTAFNPGACGSPTFAGQLTVNFGDGTTFGPSPLATYDCGGGGGGGEKCDKVVPGHNCDPGGVFQGDTKKPPKKASVDEAKKGLKFVLELGVKGKVTTTIEVKGEEVGKTSAKAKSGKDNKLVAKLSSSAAHDLAGKTTKALIHVEVIPNAQAEGFTTHGREYFKLKLTG
ncbi:MAG: hypothetical protein QOI10_2216 [Solirubrobacterales bacterium]|jgi:hypothetical protein|nr:hypothetical protein [Solirubrobacterales bacterium]